MPRWWPFGGNQQPTSQGGGGAIEHAGSEPAPSPLDRGGEVTRAATEQAAPRPVVARIVSPQQREPAAPEDLQTAADFHRSLVNRLWDDARPGLLGDGGGLGDMAAFLREASHLAGGVMDKPVSHDVMRTGDDLASTHSVEPLRPRDLSTLMSFSEPEALLVGRALDMPFGERPSESAAPTGFQPFGPAALPKFGPATPPERLNLPDVPGSHVLGRRAAQPPVDTVPSPPPASRRFADARAHEGTERPPAPGQPLVSRSVPADTFRANPQPAIDRAAEPSRPAPPPLRLPSDVSGTATNIESFRSGPRAIRSESPPPESPALTLAERYAANDDFDNGPGGGLAAQRSPSPVEPSGGAAPPVAGPPSANDEPPSHSTGVAGAMDIPGTPQAISARPTGPLTTVSEAVAAFVPPNGGAAPELTLAEPPATPREDGMAIHRAIASETVTEIPAAPSPSPAREIQAASRSDETASPMVVPPLTGSLAGPSLQRQAEPNVRIAPAPQPGTTGPAEAVSPVAIPDPGSRETVAAPTAEGAYRTSDESTAAAASPAEGALPAATPNPDPRETVAAPTAEDTYRTSDESTAVAVSPAGARTPEPDLALATPATPGPLSHESRAADGVESTAPTGSTSAAPGEMRPPLGERSTTPEVLASTGLAAIPGSEAVTPDAAPAIARTVDTSPLPLSAATGDDAGIAAAPELPHPITPVSPTAGAVASDLPLVTGGSGTASTDSPGISRATESPRPDSPASQSLVSESRSSSPSGERRAPLAAPPSPAISRRTDTSSVPSAGPAERSAPGIPPATAEVSTGSTVSSDVAPGKQVTGSSPESAPLPSLELTRQARITRAADTDPTAAVNEPSASPTHSNLPTPPASAGIDSPSIARDADGAGVTSTPELPRATTAAGSPGWSAGVVATNPPEDAHDSDAIPLELRRAVVDGPSAASPGDIGHRPGEFTMTGSSPDSAPASVQRATESAPGNTISRGPAADRPPSTLPLADSPGADMPVAPGRAAIGAGPAVTPDLALHAGRAVVANEPPLPGTTSDTLGRHPEAGTTAAAPPGTRQAPQPGLREPLLSVEAPMTPPGQDAPTTDRPSSTAIPRPETPLVVRSVPASATFTSSDELNTVATPRSSHPPAHPPSSPGDVQRHAAVPSTMGESASMPLPTSPRPLARLSASTETLAETSPTTISRVIADATAQPPAMELPLAALPPAEADTNDPGGLVGLPVATPGIQAAAHQPGGRLTTSVPLTSTTPETTPASHPAQTPSASSPATQRVLRTIARPAAPASGAPAITPVPAMPATTPYAPAGATFTPDLTWAEGSGPAALQRFADQVTTRNHAAEFARPATPLTLQSPARAATPPAASAAPLAPHVQRTPEFGGHEAVGQFSETIVNRVLPAGDAAPGGNQETPAGSDLSAITEHVWREIRRRLRVERERSRGVM